MPTFGLNNRSILGAPPVPQAPATTPVSYAALPPAPSLYQGRAAAPAAPLNPLVGRMAAPPAGVPAGFGAAPAAPVQRTSNSLGVSASTPGRNPGLPANTQRAAGSGQPGMKTVGGFNFY
jgi:hypothetical protein